MHEAMRDEGDEGDVRRLYTAISMHRTRIISDRPIQYPCVYLVVRITLATSHT